MQKLGFGCVRLTYNLTEKQAIRNLEVAYDSGITHFDVARLYGFGAAENILGKFAKYKRDKITITSKFGIFPGNPVMKNLIVQNITRYLFNLAKKLPIKSATQKAAGKIMSPRMFSVSEAKNSLETSLRELQTDFIDYYLMHEPTIQQTNSAELIEFLESQKRKGIIGEYGIGSFADKIIDDFQNLASQYTVLQTDNSFPFTTPFAENLAKEKKTFFFSPFRYYSLVKEIIKEDNNLQNIIFSKTGINSKENLIDLFLLFQLHTSDNATTLFTSASNENIKGTVRRWEKIKSASVENDDMKHVASILQSRIKSK